MALPGQDRFGYAVSELMQRMQIYGTYVLGVYDELIQLTGEGAVAIELENTW